MARTKPVLNVVDFENSIGQVIKPGDEVVIVSSGYNHSISIKKGTYLGRKGSENGVSCRVTEQYTRYRFKETGEDVGYYWHEHAKKRGVMPEYPEYPKYPEYDRANYRYGTPEYTAANEKRTAIANEFQKKTAEYHTKCGEIGKEYEAFKVPYFRHTTLQRNRIYKLDTPAVDLEV